MEGSVLTLVATVKFLRADGIMEKNTNIELRIRKMLMAAWIMTVFWLELFLTKAT